MSQRLDQEREQLLQPKRMEYAKAELAKRGYEITYQDETRIEFFHNGSKIQLYPYSGWFTGKTVKDGRGIALLLKQLNP